MLLIQLVHAGHQPSPSRLVLPFARLLFQMVVELIEADQLAHEVTLLIDERVLQQIARPRLFQAQNAHHEVGQVEFLRTAVHHLLTGKLNHLSHLHRSLRLILLVLRHRLDVLQLLLQSLYKLLYRIEYVECPVEVELVCQHKQQVFGHHKLVSVFLTARHRLFQHLRRPFCLSYLCHKICVIIVICAICEICGSFQSFSGSTVSLSGNPASLAIPVAFLTFEVATS